MFDIPEGQTTNGLNYLETKTNRTFLKIIYRLNSDTTNDSTVNLNYNLPDEKYVNFETVGKGSDLQISDEDTGKSFGEFHFNPISAIKELSNETSLNLIDKMVFNITGLEGGTQYIISIKDHFSRIDPGEGNNFLNTRVGYGFKITLKNEEDIITDTVTNENLESGALSGEDAIGFPSIIYCMCRKHRFKIRSGKQ